MLTSPIVSIQPTGLPEAAAIKAYDVLSIEEPAVPGHIEVFKRIKRPCGCRMDPYPTTGASAGEKRL